MGQFSGPDGPHPKNPGSGAVNQLRMGHFWHKVENKLRYHFLPAKQTIARWFVADKRTRDWLNSRYLLCSANERQRLHRLYSKIFRDHDQPIDPGNWRAEFAGTQVLLPLSGSDAWREWDLAISACGQDIELKLTYETLIRSHRPGQFFDLAMPVEEVQDGRVA